MKLKITITKEVDTDKLWEAASLFDADGNLIQMTDKELARVLKSEFDGGWIEAMDIICDADWKAEVVG